MEMDALIIAMSAFGGSAIAGALGYLKANENWIWRKYLVTLLSGVGSAIAFSLAYQYSGNSLTVFDILVAIAAGAGVDNGVNRIVGYFGK